MIEHDSESLHFIKYSFHSGPGKEIRRGGILEINCQGWAHRRLAEELNIILPQTLLSKELFEDTAHTQTVAEIHLIQPGAIFMFGPTQLTDTKFLHWALYLGLKSPQGEPLLEHVNNVDKSVGIWPLSQFKLHAKYEQIYAIKQPIS